MRTIIQVADSLRRGDGRYSKKDVLNETGMAWGTVCSAADELAAKGYVQAITKKQVGRGRPVVPLRLVPDSAFFLGIDIGASRTKLALYDLNFKITKQNNFPTRYYSGEKYFFHWLETHLGRFLFSCADVRKKIRAIGLSVSGNVNAKQGVIVSARNFGIPWDANVPIVKKLQADHNIPVHLVTSQAAGVWAEYNFGRQSGCRNIVCVSLGVGIGSGVVSDGQLILSFPNRPVGYIGHLLIPGNKRVCVCGFRGCLEAFSGGKALAEIAAESFPENSKIRSAKDLDIAATAGDKTARKILTTAASYNTAGIVSMLQLYLPEVIIFSGQQCQVNGFLYSKIYKMLKMTLPEERRKIFKFDISCLGQYQAALGAARLAYENFF